MIGRLLNLAEDVIAFLGSFVGVFLILHLVERLAHGLAMKGFLCWLSPVGSNKCSICTIRA